MLFEGPMPMQLAQGQAAQFFGPEVATSRFRVSLICEGPPCHVFQDFPVPSFLALMK